MPSDQHHDTPRVSPGLEGALGRGGSAGTAAPSATFTNTLISSHGDGAENNSGCSVSAVYISIFKINRP